MRIRNYIFTYFILATIVPLVILALSVSYYSEQTYQQDIEREIITSLNRATIEFTHELQNSRNLVLGIARASAVQSFFPILRSIKKGEDHPSIRLLRKKINRYLEGFQTIIPGAFILRVLDFRGDTLVKVSHNKTSQAQYESLQGINYVEHQVPTADFVEQLKDLPRDEVSFFSLPHHQLDNETNLPKSLLDYIVPLYDDDETWIGSLAVTLSGEQLDRIISNVTRLYQGKIFITENNPDDKKRHGMLIYDEASDLSINQLRLEPQILNEKLKTMLFNESIENVEGFINNNKIYSYYSEFFPYPNRLIGWVIAINIDASILTEPFSKNRLNIWLLAALALLLTLIMAAFTVRKISKPICSLAYQLKSFADGNHQKSKNTYQAITEVQVLSSSFDYMVNTLLKTQGERDKAQNMALQNNKLASIGQMAAGIGHEINNPLNNILSYSTLISRAIAKISADIDTKDLTRLQSDIDTLRNETLRASEIIKGILNFSRQMPPQMMKFNVTNWLNKSTSLVQQTAKTQDISIQIHFNSPENDCIEADEAQLQQVLINLLLNAIQASDVGSSITVKAKCDEQQLEVIIQDQGCGISEEDLNNIFDPFFSTKEEGEGSGLGLSISLGIIESHHGSLVITSTKEINGTIATIILPIKQNEGL
ncbi:MAG: ATP-binding protein [Woeseiaceae bacterium]